MSDEDCLIRNATSVLVYGGKRFLIDPVLAQKGAYPAFQRTINADLRNPLVNLPIPVEDVVRDVDAVVTNVHRDHWDEAAAKVLPKGFLLLTNNEEDAATLTSQGFTNVQVMAQDGTDLGSNITLHKTPCRCELEGSAAQAQDGDAGTHGITTTTGLVFQRPGRKTVYFVSDSVFFFAGVEDSLTAYKPDFVVVNVGDASVEGVGHIMRGRDDVPRILKAAPDAVFIAQRLEAANHCVVSRQILREFAGIKGLASHVFIPADGECVLVSD